MIVYLLLFFVGLCVGSFLNAAIWRLEREESVVFFFRHPEFISGSQRHKNGKDYEMLKPACNDVATSGRQVQHDKFAARSYCPHCKTTLHWYDLMPVLSFVLLKGKCRYCNKKISIQYPLVEITTGLIFLLIFSAGGARLPMTGTVGQGSAFGGNFSAFAQGFGGQAIFNFQSISNLSIFNWITLCYLLYVTCSMIVIFVYDLKHYIIPDKILFPAIGVSIMYRIYESLISFLTRHAELVSASHETLKQVQGDELWAVENWQALLLYFLAALVASGFFFALVALSKGRWMGLGDVKLAFLMGLILGWPNILVALFLAFMLGAVVGVGLILMPWIFQVFQSLALGSRELSSGKRSYTLKSQIPFGPFLILGTFIALFWGNQLIDWYTGLLF